MKEQTIVKRVTYNESAMIELLRDKEVKDELCKFIAQNTTGNTFNKTVMRFSNFLLNENNYFIFNDFQKSDIKKVIDNKTPIVIIGQTGTGKTTLLIQLLHEFLTGGKSIVVDEHNEFKSYRFNTSELDLINKYNTIDTKMINQYITSDNSNLVIDASEHHINEEQKEILKLLINITKNQNKQIVMAQFKYNEFVKKLFQNKYKEICIIEIIKAYNEDSKEHKYFIKNIGFESI